MGEFVKLILMGFPDGSKMKEFTDGRVCKINSDGSKVDFYK